MLEIKTPNDKILLTDNLIPFRTEDGKIIYLTIQEYNVKMGKALDNRENPIPKNKTILNECSTY